MANEKRVKELLDELVEGRSSEEMLAEDRPLDDLTKLLMERVLEGELTEHLGYEKHAREDRDLGNSRNGRTKKRVKTGSRGLELEVPRDRDGSLASMRK